MSLDERAISIASGALSLEGMLHEGASTLAAVVLHPHPRYGGDMDNHVVLAICETFAFAGATTLRFNFRGAGRSEGSFDNGRGEADDARAAAALLRAGRPDRRFVLAGYSFGALVAAAVASDVAPAAIVLVSPPVGFAPLAPLPPGVPALILTGDRDPVSPAEAARRMAAQGRRVAVVPGADHGWWPGADTLSEEIRAFTRHVAVDVSHA